MKTSRLLIVLMLLGAILFASCSDNASVGPLQTESQSVELGGAGPVSVKIDFGAGDLHLAGGAEKLLEASFTYNVAKLKPEVEHTANTLVVRQPETKGLPALQGITDFRNEWSLRLSNKTPMDLRLNLGAGTSDLQLAGLSLTGLDIKLGAGTSTVDLTGNWARNLDITIDTGAADLSVRLPKDVGVRVKVDAGPTVVEAQGLTKAEDVYTNGAYGVSNVTLHIDMKAGIGRVSLESE